jgi:hypothetical protein
MEAWLAILPWKMLEDGPETEEAGASQRIRPAASPVCTARRPDVGSPMNAVETRRAKFSVPSIIAIVAALLSFTTGAFWGFVLAIIAMIFGLIGVFLSLSPSIRGGVVSFLSLVAGALGLMAAVVKAIMWLF